jgi:hypothetical protein
VAAGLWDKAPGGYVFHDWAKYQPSRDEVETRREAWKERQRKARMSRSDTQRDSTGDSQRESRRESLSPVPSRPVPSSKEKNLVRAALEQDFDEFWKVYPRKDGKQAAQRKYATVRKTVPAEPILEGARAYALMSLGKEKEHVKMAQGWLNDGRWADELQSSIPLPPRDNVPVAHTHRWLPNGTCNFCDARQENTF